MATYRIGEVAKRTGVSASAIRYYEQEGLIPPPIRRSGRRVFGEEIFDQLTIIALAQAAGFTIGEIRSFLKSMVGGGAPGKRWRSLAERKIVELDEQIATAKRMQRVLKTMIGCECPTLVDCARAAKRH